LVIQADEPEASGRMKFQRMDIAPAFEIIFRDPGPLDLPWLVKLIASKRYSLIGLESLNTLLSTDKCEATDAGMSRLVYLLNKAFVDHGVAGILTHHLNKPQDRMLRKSVNHHDIGGASILLAACTDIWSLCRSPNDPHCFDLACHGKRNCRRGSIFHLKGNEEDYSWQLYGTSDGIQPQERFHLEQLILNHFTNNPEPLPLDQLAQCLDTSYEHTRRVALDLFDNNQQITRTKLTAQGRGRPKYLYGPAT
jgi:hypothetical protein